MMAQDKTKVSGESDSEAHETTPHTHSEACGTHCHGDHGLRKTLPHSPTAPKIGRNDPCLCGSGKKYKKCCLG